MKLFHFSRNKTGEKATSFERGLKDKSDLSKVINEKAQGQMMIYAGLKEQLERAKESKATVGKKYFRGTDDVGGR